ncbi:MAG: hypothetical protein LLF76_02760 [Planctomycetaceae bacterium]|nr:hypothetical protein [Planctomycetaceae bacterium]
METEQVFKEIEKHEQLLVKLQESFRQTIINIQRVSGAIAALKNLVEVKEFKN